jgi:hypothetical protein
LVRVDLAKLVEWVKLGPRYLGPLWLVLGVLLFAPEGLLRRFGLAEFADDYRPYVGVLFLLSSAFLISAVVAFLWEFAVEWLDEGLTVRNGRRRLQNLTPADKEVLRAYVEGDTRTRYFTINNGVVKGLEHEGVLYRASNLGRGSTFPYNLQPWAWEHLKAHPELLARDASHQR